MYKDYEECNWSDEDYEENDELDATEEDDDYEEIDYFEEDNPLADWKAYRDSGGFCTYKEWLEDHGYIKYEEWVPAYEFEGVYEVSDLGRIRNIWTGTVLKQYTNKKGYKQVVLYMGGAKFTRRVHILVARSFLRGDYTGLDVHHKDTDKTNNRLDNLIVCTRKEHVKYSIKDGTFSFNNFGKNGVKVKCLNNGKIYDSMRECGRDLGLDYKLISQYLRGKIKMCKGYQFEKVE